MLRRYHVSNFHAARLLHLFSQSAQSRAFAFQSSSASTQPSLTHPKSSRKPWISNALPRTSHVQIRLLSSPAEEDEGGERTSSAPRNNGHEHRYGFQHTKHEAAQRELLRLGDPLKLADRVQKLLRSSAEGDYDKAVQLLRLASRSQQCIVAWNHLIGHNMLKGATALASKQYNEMKQRGQIPDSYTYTALFRGFALNPHYNQSLPRALSIYLSMFSDTSPVKPSVLHTNAVLKVCAMVGDIDALLGVAARLPTKGRDAADRVTFTIVLQALAKKVQNSDMKLRGRISQSDRTSETIVRGRRIWEEIRGRWSTGDLEMDESLVCAMGRLLLLSHAQHDAHDALSLLQQTMGIENMVPRDEPSEAASIDNDIKAASPEESDQSTLHQINVISTDPVGESGDEADPFAPLPHYLPNQAFVRPGSNTLSLAIEACDVLHAYKAGTAYWKKLTADEPYAIAPDRQAYHDYLRLLRTQRATRMVSDLIEEMALRMQRQKLADINATDPSYLQPFLPKTFKIALSTCARDKFNPAAFEYARRIVGTMAAYMDPPDPRCIRYLIDTSLTHSWQPPSKGERADVETISGRDTASGQDRIIPRIQSRRNNNAGPSSNSMDKSEDSSARADNTDSQPAFPVTSRQHDWRQLVPVAQEIQHVYFPALKAWYQDTNREPDRRRRAVGSSEEEQILDMVRRTITLWDTIIDCGRESLAPAERRSAISSREILHAWWNRTRARRHSIFPTSARDHDSRSQIDPADPDSNSAPASAFGTDRRPRRRPTPLFMHPVSATPEFATTPVFEHRSGAEVSPAAQRAQSASVRKDRDDSDGRPRRSRGRYIGHIGLTEEDARDRRWRRETSERNFQRPNRYMGGDSAGWQAGRTRATERVHGGRSENRDRTRGPPDLRREHNDIGSNGTHASEITGPTDKDALQEDHMDFDEGVEDLRKSQSRWT